MTYFYFKLSSYCSNGYIFKTIDLTVIYTEAKVGGNLISYNFVLDKKYCSLNISKDTFTSSLPINNVRPKFKLIILITITVCIVA